jgi:hypothetical protein
MLFANHRRTGACEPVVRIVEYPSVEISSGIHRGGKRVVWTLGLRDVESIHSKGATKTAVSSIKAA